MPAPPGERQQKPQLDRAPRVFAPPPTEDAYAPDTGELLAADPRTPQERLEAHVALTAPAVDTLSKRRVRRLTLIALGQLAEGYTVPDIAQNMGVSPATITKWFLAFRFDLKKFDVDRMLDELIVPLAAQNVAQGVLAGDKDYSLEILKGRGKLKRYTEKEGAVVHELPPLVVRFERSPLPSASDSVLTHLSDPHPTPGVVVGVVAIPKGLPAPTRAPLEVPHVVERSVEVRPAPVNSPAVSVDRRAATARKTHRRGELPETGLRGDGAGEPRPQPAGSRDGHAAAGADGADHAVAGRGTDAV